MAKQRAAASKPKNENPIPPSMLKPPEDAPQSPSDWLCNNVALVGPDGRKFRHGEHVADFETWPVRAQQRLREMHYVCRRAVFVGAFDIAQMTVPAPELVAKVRAATGKPKAANPTPEFDHFMPFDPDVKVDDRAAPSLPLELEPGSTIELADGTRYTVPLDKVPEDQEPIDPIAQQDGVDNMRVSCGQCNEMFDGIASLKQHELGAHLA